MLIVFAVSGAAEQGLDVGVAFVGGGGGGSDPVPAQVSSPRPSIPAPAEPATTATGAQVQQALLEVMTRLRTPGPDGQMKAVTPAEIEAQLRTELAKTGLIP